VLVGSSSAAEVGIVAGEDLVGSTVREEDRNQAVGRPVEGHLGEGRSRAVAGRSNLGWTLYCGGFVCLRALRKKGGFAVSMGRR